MDSVRIILSSIALFTAIFACLSQPISEEMIEKIDSYVNSDPDSAIILCNDAIKRLPSRPTTAKVSLLTVRGNAAFTLGDYPAVISDFCLAVKSAEEIPDTMACVNALSDLGVAYRVS